MADNAKDNMTTENMTTENKTTDAKLWESLNSISGSDAMGRANDLDPSLADALEELPSSNVVRAQALPQGIYTQGDTSGREKALPEMPFTALPSRVTRRYSPVRGEEVTSSSLAPPPSFSAFAADPSSHPDQVYPSPPPRAGTVSELKVAARVHAHAAESVGNTLSQSVPTDPRVAALLERMGMAVPEEAARSDARRQTRSVAALSAPKPRRSFSQEAAPVTLHSTGSLASARTVPPVSARAADPDLKKN